VELLTKSLSIVRVRKDPDLLDDFINRRHHDGGRDQRADAAARS
jgi:hypothetical protein